MQIREARKQIDLIDPDADPDLPPYHARTLALYTPQGWLPNKVSKDDFVLVSITSLTDCGEC
jgi:hypothetical protein